MEENKGDQRREWNETYWDIINNLYWTPRYLGLKSIPRKKWEIIGDRVSVALSDIANQAGPLYSRSRKYTGNHEYLFLQEEILNHFFDLTFAIAGDALIVTLLCAPLGIDDRGPFLSPGREIWKRYNWGPNENVTQPDGYFVSRNSAVGVELKLASSSWPEQIAKYAALMVWEEMRSSKLAHLGLLFIVPENSLDRHWSKVGLVGPVVAADFLTKLDQQKLPAKINQLFEEQKGHIESVLERLKLKVVTWTEFRAEIAKIQTELDCVRPGDQTLNRLLAGLCAQIDAHEGTGIPKPTAT